MTRRPLTALIVSLTVALALATSALAAGEPKNTAPFTRSTAFAVPAHRLAAEPKNVVPFDRTVTGPSAAPDWFERYAAAHPYGRGAGSLVTASTATETPDAFERYAAEHPYGQHISSAPIASETSAANFRWRDALVGAAATAGLLLLAGSVLLAISRRRKTLSTALQA